ncbi:hypothetical protein ACLOJK_005071 [Asimina triloba]
MSSGNMGQRGLEVTGPYTVGRATTAEEKLLRSSTEVVAFRSKIKALRACNTNLNASKESSRTGEVSTLPERVDVPSSRELELLAESETMRAKVARLQTELETLQVKHLQSMSTQGGDTLSSGSIFASTRALVITEYLESDVHRRREEFGCSHHSQSGHVKALSIITRVHSG